MATSIQQIRQPAIDLPITTPVTEQTYYTLYVHNPQVSCICALFNRIIYFLFSWMGCCLGKASDQSKKISMQNEITLIHNFTIAEKELLSALRTAENNQGQGTQQGTQTEQGNYFNALKARQEQINSFDFSPEALAQGCQKADLLAAARLRLEEQLKAPLPASLMGILSQWEPEQPSFSHLEQPPSRQKITQPAITPSSSPSNPPLNMKSRAERLDDTRKVVTDQLLKNPNFNLVAKSDIQDYIEALKAYHAFRTDSSEDFSHCYIELTALSSALNKLKDGRLPLVLEFAKQFGLIQNDPQFVDTYAAQTRNYYIDCYFRLPICLPYDGGAFVVLQSYFNTIGEIYRTAHPDTSEEEMATYAKKQVTMLLTDVHKGYAAKYADISKPKESGLEEESYELAQHLHCFAADAQPDVQAKGARFIEDVLNGKAVEAGKNTVQNSQSSASQSTSSSQSSVASISLSSSTSIVGSTSTSSLDTQPVEGVEMNAAEFYLNTRKALLKSFGELQIVNRIPSQTINNFAHALKKYAEKFNSKLPELLNQFYMRCYDIGIDLDTGDKPVSPNEILTLNIYLAQQLGIADTGFLEKAITTMFDETVSGIYRSCLPSAIKKQSLSQGSNLFQIFFTTVKRLSVLVQPKSNHSEYAKEQLKKLFIAMHKDAIVPGYYEQYATGNTSAKTSIEKLLIQIAAALPGFGPGASKEAQVLAENLLTSITISAGS